MEKIERSEKSRTGPSPTKPRDQSLPKLFTFPLSKMSSVSTRISKPVVKAVKAKSEPTIYHLCGACSLINGHTADCVNLGKPWNTVHHRVWSGSVFNDKHAEEFNKPEPKPEEPKPEMTAAERRMATLRLGLKCSFLMARAGRMCGADACGEGPTRCAKHQPKSA